MGNLIRAVFFGVILLLSLQANAQLKCKIEHFTTEDGLSHNRVMCMIKDREGFMWFGTWDGINRFDGHNFIIYKSKPGDTSSLRNNRIDDIVEDRAGYLWLKAYDNQIYRFDKKKEQFLAISDQLHSAGNTKFVFENMILSANGPIWLQTKNQGIFYVPDPGSAHLRFFRYANGLGKDFSLPSNNITFFYEDAQRLVWVGTPNGISCLKRNAAGTYINVKLNQAFSKGYNFTSVAENKDMIWLGTSNGYLVVYKKATRQFISKRVSANQINGIRVSKKRNAAYLSTSGGEIITIDPAHLNISSSSLMAGAPALFSIYEDRSGLLWIEPEKHGVIKYDPVKKTFKHFTQRNDANYENLAKYYNIFEDKDGVVWTNMKGEGFGYYDPATDKVNYFYDEPGSQNYRFSNLVPCTYMDPVGVLWLNADDRGLNKIVFQRKDFNQKLLVDHTMSRSDNEIRGIYTDTKGRLWLASKAGQLYVYAHDKKVPVVFNNVPSGGLGVIYNIIEDRYGNMWMGTKGYGLYKAVPVGKDGLTYNVTHYQTDKKDIYSLSSNVIYALLEDKKGRIWVGTFEEGFNLIEQKGGKTLFLNNKNSFKNYPRETFNRVRNLSEDVHGNIWVATTEGLLVLDPNKGNPANYRFATFSKIAGDKTSLGKNDIQYIYRDSKNTMWLSTSGGGLNKAITNDPFKSLKFKVYTTDNGLPSDYLLSSVEDKRGNLWLATENGLSKFVPDKEKFINYDSYDGLPPTGFSESSSLKLPNGDLVFGCITGYISFNPDEIAYHKISANMALTNLQVNNKDVVLGGPHSPLQYNLNDSQHIVLKYNENILGIDYSLLDYRSSNKQSYAYRLVGFDKVWHDNKSQRRATYTNLPPGSYVFEVKSSSEGLYSNNPYKKLAITILPPPWLTWWAYLIYIIIAVVLIEVIRRTAFTMLRLRQRIAVEKKLADLKLSFFTNVSHELRTPLTLILNPIEEIYKKESLSPQGNEHINVVRKNAKRMVRFVNQLLDLRKVQSGKATLKISKVEMIAFVKKISEYFTDVAHEKQITMVLESDAVELYAWIDAEKLDIVIYNLLANAFKFTPAGKTIKILVNEMPEGEGILVQIADQGQGVAENKLNDIFELYYEGEHGEGKNLKGTGIGLALSKELVNLHHGRIFAKNNADRGLTVTVELKTGKEHLIHDEVVFIDVPDVPHEMDEEIEDLFQAAEPPAHQHNASVPLVLLVEDNNDLRAFLKVQLGEFYRVELAENGEEGLEKAIKLLPDLILTDVMMPKMDGIQMMDKLKNNSTTSHIPIVLLTAKFSVESQIEALKYGADYYITKPFQNDFLLASIDNLIRQRKKVFEMMLNKKKTVDLSPAEIVITSQDEVFLKKVIKIVEDNMSDPEFNIDTVAGSIHMGRSAFYKKFKSLTNLAPVEFVREMRLKRAKQILDAGESNISEIAYMVGFNNAKYFSTCFKEQYQLSPTEYLKSKAQAV